METAYVLTHSLSDDMTIVSKTNVKSLMTFIFTVRPYATANLEFVNSLSLFR